MGYESVQVEADDSRGQTLSEPHVLPCYTDVSSGDPKSISSTAPGGVITVTVRSLSHSVAVIGLEVSPQAV